MDYHQSFSSLNERLRPRMTSSPQLYSSLTRVEERQSGSLRSLSSSNRPTFSFMTPEPKEAAAEPEDPEQPEDTAEQDFVSGGLEEGRCDDSQPFFNSCLITELNLKDLGDEDTVTSPSEEKDIPGELVSKGSGNSSESAGGEGGSPFQRSYEDGSLPDLIRSGRPLARRRTVGHVTETLKEVRREVELSRRRSIKLKAQVDKLQESREGVGWSQHRERVTEEVLSVLRLLRPLTEPASTQPEPSRGENNLDDALVQLQNVARQLAISHTKQFTSGNGAGDSALLQQALCDRDDAIERKKAMEAELLRSKTEMMSLNNQLLEAVQKRLELSLEVEAWKEDLQLLMQQQVLAQQQAEQAQKKPSRMGLLRRHNKPPIQRPSSNTYSSPAPSTVNSSQIFISRSAVSAAPSAPSPPSSRRNWMDKLRRGKSSTRQEEQDSEWDAGDNGFQVVSLD
ncbi:bicaudal-D-related protein 2-like [Sparus aurata]|uniref:bicaudal-D-related protein 2-like n=1 Tax=Sparus aurata TaxID=8175 RepID=UPI0011C12791|nr:uncharacterized protein LOC115594180 [Sparus aurata]